MVYYGPWEQFDDYERPGVLLTWDDGATGGAGAHFQDDPQNPLLPLTGNDASDMNTRLTQADAAAIVGPDENFPVSIGGYLPDLGRPDNGYKVGNGARRIGPRPGVLDAPTWMVPPWFDWPEGATGYEFAADSGTVIAASLELGGVLPAGSEDDYSDPDGDGVRAKIGNWDLALFIRRDQGKVPADYDGTQIASWAYPSSMVPNSGLVDVTSVASENDGRFILLGKAHAGVGEFDLDDNDGNWGCSLNIAIQESVSGASTNPGYGSFAAHYTIRPPLFRWVYEQPPLTSAPPLRQFPRDDALGTSSTTRVWSSSQQGSLRRVGYF